jgi:hypothetical protein
MRESPRACTMHKLCRQSSVYVPAQPISVYYARVCMHTMWVVRRRLLKLRDDKSMTLHILPNRSVYYLSQEMPNRRTPTLLGRRHGRLQQLFTGRTEPSCRRLDRTRESLGASPAELAACLHLEAPPRQGRPPVSLVQLRRRRRLHRADRRRLRVDDVPSRTDLLGQDCDCSVRSRTPHPSAMTATVPPCRRHRFNTTTKRIRHP